MMLSREFRVRDSRARCTGLILQLDPVWNETFKEYLDSKLIELYIDIFDYDMVGMNDFLGRAKIQIASIEPDSTIDEWFELG